MVEMATGFDAAARAWSGRLLVTWSPLATILCHGFRCVDHSTAFWPGCGPSKNGDVVRIVSSVQLGGENWLGE
ncbi:hypothetical protein DL95DRAFT_381591, partial [Leptodontidium sp. 2 PMI_412]